MRSLLLWMLGVPIPVIILIALFMHGLGSFDRRSAGDRLFWIFLLVVVLFLVGISFIFGDVAGPFRPYGGLLCSWTK